MKILAHRRGETREIHYASWKQLRNIVRHARRWAVELERVTTTVNARSRKRILKNFDHK